MDKTEIIIIDDKEPFGNSLSTFIKERCYHNAKFFLDSNSEQALDYVKNSSVKVVILDWLMNPSGKEMYDRFMKINPYLQIIFITGEAGDELLKDDLGRGNVIKLHKSYIERDLPAAINDSINNYKHKLTKMCNPPVLYNKEIIRGFFYYIPISYFILDIFIVNEYYEKDWRTIDKIERGQSSRTLNRKSAALKTETMTKMNFGIESDVENNAFLKNLLPALIKIRENNEKVIKTESGITVIEEKEITMQIGDDEEIDGSKVECKVYEQAQVFEELLVHIKRSSSIYKKMDMEEEQLFTKTIYLPRKLIDTRIRIYTVDEKEHIINTGYVSY